MDTRLNGAQAVLHVLSKSVFTLNLHLKLTLRQNLDLRVHLGSKSRENGVAVDTGGVLRDHRQHTAEVCQGG